MVEQRNSVVDYDPENNSPTVRRTSVVLLDCWVGQIVWYAFDSFLSHIDTGGVERMTNKWQSRSPNVIFKH